MPRITLTYSLANATHVGRGPRRVAAAWVRRIALWADRARQRRVLASLDDRLLSDIGITRTDAMRECEKPFWR